MGEPVDTKVRFDKDLMSKVMQSCPLTGHSAKMFIEECVSTCLEMIDDPSPTPLTPPFIEMARRKKHGRTSYRPVYDSQQMSLIREELGEIKKQLAQPTKKKTG